MTKKITKVIYNKNDKKKKKKNITKIIFLSMVLSRWQAIIAKTSKPLSCWIH